ncbi:M14 family zinc carboxypeptidase [Glycomyces harbinensis]|uniref:Zinc carboxypeptidase n=1 Tax=Glycomyces harbinensis TaxID=58114 RepID=A0A1G6RP96_9ACTN|nr:M14 family zinc carboxypeptidase [Glycomyces harbinensis]SDD06184.1 Zinc carboxypeptidase [Glycomyces harbinensis]
MHMKRRLATAGIALGLVAAATGAATLTAQAEPAEPADSSETVTWTVGDLTADELARLEQLGFDVAHEHGGDAHILGDEAVAEELRALGHDPEFFDTVYKEVGATVQQEGTYYGGYRTVDSYEADLQDVADANPDLTVLHDIGDSWLKTEGQGGHDVYAICVTKLADGDCQTAPDSTKPRFSLIAQIHAREIATGEIAMRWIDKLVAGYGTDPAVTELLDTTEVWVVPMANPDGTDIVASGGDDPILQRKNANDSNGNCGDSLGVDLNRNSSFEWGADSTNPCAETFQGPSAASEPETQAIEDWLRALHPDQRGENPDDAAPADARDVFISLHSYGNYIILPWGYTDDKAPNDAALRDLGAAMAESNGYFVGTNDDTVGYSTSGTTDDFTYGEFGIASYTFEVGEDFGDCGGFFPAYECVDDTLWPENEGALLTAAQAAAAPYGG